MSAIGPKRTCTSALHMSAFEGKADMPLCGCPLLRSLSGVKQTSVFAAHMSACDPKRTWLFHPELDYGPSWKACVSYQELEIVLRGQRTATEYRGRIQCPPRISPVAMLEN